MHGRVSRKLAWGAMAAIFASGCDDVSERPADVAAATPAPVASPPVASPPDALSPLVEYSRAPDKSVSFAADPLIFNYFCNALAATDCDATSQEKFATAGFADGQSVSDLAFAAVNMKARLNLPGQTGEATDEQFVVAAYEVVLGRAPDPQGLQSNLQYLAASKDRKGAVRSMVASPEFQQRRT